MKKTIVASAFIFSLGVGLPALELVAEEESDPQKVQGVEQEQQESVEQGWRDSLKVQMALAKTKVSLLQARSQLLLEESDEAVFQSLDKARANLDKGWRSADQVTRARINDMRSQLDKVKGLVREKREGTEAELRDLVEHSESALNAAVTKTQAHAADLENEAATRYALVQAKAAVLEARVALEIEQSPDKARQALANAETALQRVKATASKTSTEQMIRLQKQAQTARRSVGEETGAAKAHVVGLLTSIEAQMQTYKMNLQDSDETRLMKKRYGQLEAQAALLKANLAARSDATSERTAAYLDESKAWYESLKVQASDRGNKELAKMSTRIDDTKQAMKRKDKQARTKLANLLEEAAEMIKDED